MEAQLVIVMQNGYAEAREPRLRNRFEVVDVEKAANIKAEVWKHLNRIGRNGCVLVRWNGKMYQCEMKADKKGYNRIEIDYHPHQDKFTI
jgi:hypothetical protein